MAWSAGVCFTVLLPVASSGTRSFGGVDPSGQLWIRGIWGLQRRVLTLSCCAFGLTGTASVLQGSENF